MVQLPTAREALTQAYERLQLGNVADAEVWISLAREIREGSTPPLITRWLEASRPGDRLTLHDVEGIVCAHGRVAIRPKRATGARWFMHTDDGTNCEQDDARNEASRRFRATDPVLDETQRYAETGKLDPLPDDLLFGALPKAAWDRVTVVPQEPAKVAPVAESFGNPLRPDKIFGYARGQNDPPSEAQTRYALVWRESLDAGSPLPPPFTEADVPAVRSLVDEILDRGHHYLLEAATTFDEQPKPLAPDTTQTMPRELRLDRRIEDDPAVTAQLDASQLAPGRHSAAGLCKHCHFEIYEIGPAQPGAPVAKVYRHTMTGQAVCHVRTQPGQAVTFATPTASQVASGE